MRAAPAAARTEVPAGYGRLAQTWYKARAARRSPIITTPTGALRSGSHQVAGNVPALAAYGTPRGNEGRFLHDHGGAVFLVARRQRAADRRHRARSSDSSEPEWMTPALQAVLRGVLRRAGAAGRRVRRLDAQGPGHAHHQRDQGGRLPADARTRCIRSPPTRWSASAPLRIRPAKYGILTELLPAQQLVVANGWIEGTTVGSIMLGVLLGGAPHQREGVDDAARLRPSAHRHRHRYAARRRPSASSPASTSSPPSSTGSFRTPASIIACRARIRST